MSFSGHRQIVPRPVFCYDVWEFEFISQPPRLPAMRPEDIVMYCIEMEILGAHQVVGSFDKGFTFREKSGSTEHDNGVYIFLTVFFYARGALPLWHRGHIQYPNIAHCGNSLCMALHEVAHCRVSLAGIPARSKQYGKSLVNNGISCLQSTRKRLHEFVVGRIEKLHLICTRVLHGGRSSVGRAPDCGSGCRGFDPHRSPYLKRKSRHCRDFYFFKLSSIPFT